MTYYILAQKEAGIEGRWTMEFGDKDKDCVNFERDDYNDHGTPKSRLKVIRLANGRAATITAAIADLNRNVKC